MTTDDEYLKFIDNHIEKLSKLQVLLNSKVSNYQDKLLEVGIMMRTAEYFKAQYVKKTAPLQETTIDCTDYGTQWIRRTLVDDQ